MGVWICRLIILFCVNLVAGKRLSLWEELWAIVEAGKLLDWRSLGWPSRSWRWQAAGTGWTPSYICLNRCAWSASNRKRTEYGFEEHCFEDRTQWVSLALTKFRGENSGSSVQPIICVPRRTNQVFLQSSLSLTQNSVSALFRTVPSK